MAELDVAVLMVDGVNFAEHCCVVALAVTTDGTKALAGAVARSSVIRPCAEMYLAQAPERR